MNACPSHTEQHDRYPVRLFLDKLMILGQNIVLKTELIGPRPVSTTEATITSSSRDVFRPAAQSCAEGTSRETGRARTRLSSSAARVRAVERSRVSVDSAWQADTSVPQQMILVMTSTCWDAETGYWQARTSGCARRKTNYQWTHDSAVVASCYRQIKALGKCDNRYVIYKKKRLSGESRVEFAPEDLKPQNQNH